MGKPNLLFISPIMPALTGNGLAMRAGMMLEALASDYNVYLLVVPIHGMPFEGSAYPSVSKWCAGLAVHAVAYRIDPLFRLIARIKDPRERLAAQVTYPRPSLWRFATTRSVHEAVQVVQGIPFREVNVFRLYMAPFAVPYLQAGLEDRPRCRLDLDDHESRTRRRLAALFEAAGDDMNASIERSESEKYSAMEQWYLPLFDRVYVCSEHDRQAITRQYGCSNITVIPNGIRIPVTGLDGPKTSPFTFLFVGNLSYYPNEDAVLFFCLEVLPRLRATAERGAFRVLIVGTHPSRRLLALSTHSEVMVIGAVPDLASYYRDANVVVMPLRAGGGTRIKLLEAFSYRRPVVSTALGAEGIEVRHGMHLLIANTPGDFTQQCLRLMEIPALGLKLAEQAFEFVRHNHSPKRIRDLLRQDHRA